MPLSSTSTRLSELAADESALAAWAKAGTNARATSRSRELGRIFRIQRTSKSQSPRAIRAFAVVASSFSRRPRSRRPARANRNGQTGTSVRNVLQEREDAAEPVAGVLDSTIVEQLRMLARAGSSELLEQARGRVHARHALRFASLRTAIAAATPMRSPSTRTRSRAARPISAPSRSSRRARRSRSRRARVPGRSSSCVRELDGAAADGAVGARRASPCHG